MSLKYYCTKFANLNVSQSNTKTKDIPAPHQPILLLSVIELIEQGRIHRNQIFLSCELIDTFRKVWQLLVLNSSYNCDIKLPFFHLRGSGFWHLKPNPGYEARLLSGKKIRTLQELREVINYAYLDEELFALLQQQESRNILMNTLLDTWFSYTSNDTFAFIQQGLQKIDREKLSQQDLEDKGRTIVRDGAFRRLLVAVYKQRCAFCGLQILDSLGQNIVDGAHIKPFSLFYDDRIDNGLSLCKNHHWAFDRGWFSVNDDYTIVVAANLREESPHARPMRDMEGDRLNLPAQAQYYPRVEAIRWHRNNVFQAA